MEILNTVIPPTGIRVAFIDNDGKKISGLTVEQANEVSQKNPSEVFYFQNGNGVEEELTIDEVNQLSPVDLLPSNIDCPTGPQVCGPPLVRFFGGDGGFGAAANAVISPISSSVIAFDIVDPGYGFLGTPSAELIDTCGKGSGSSLQVNMEPDDLDTTNIDPITTGVTGAFAPTTGTTGTAGGTTGTTGTTAGTTGTAGGTTGTTGTAGGTTGTAGGTTGTTGTTAGTTETAGGTTETAGGTTGTTGTTGTAGGTTGTAGGTTGQIDSCQFPKDQFEKIMIRKLKRSKRIKNITILSPGDGYLSSPDGSLGGNERVWKEPDEGYVKTKCGGFYVVQPYKPIIARSGDTYYPPNEPPKIIENDEVITLPLVPTTPPNPESFAPTYSVLLVIEEIKVLDSGFGYTPGDKLIIEPSNGAEAELIINERGQIVNVEVIKSGMGFVDLPKLSTNSSTGFNATFSTILKPIRIDINVPIEDQIDQPIFGNNIQLISVIDCVGKIPPKTEFFSVPR